MQSVSAWGTFSNPFVCEAAVNCLALRQNCDCRGFATLPFEELAISLQSNFVPFQKVIEVNCKFFSVLCCQVRQSFCKSINCSAAICSATVDCKSISLNSQVQLTAKAVRQQFCERVESSGKGGSKYRKRCNAVFVQLF